MLKKQLSIGFCVLYSLFLVACGAAPSPAPVQPAAVASPAAAQSTTPPHVVVIDTDLATDDQMAILYLLRRPDVRVEAITVAGTGLTSCDTGVRQARGLTALAGKSNIAVACGRETPLAGARAFPASWRAATDHRSRLSPSGAAQADANQTAVELLTSAIRSSSQKVIIVTLGPLTNVAEALERTPALVNNLEMIYIMGGALDVPGNIASSEGGIDNRVAEWNIYIDPRAANLVLGSGAPVTLVPLDVTNHVPVTTTFYQRVEGDHRSQEATFVFDVLTKQYDFIKSGGFYFWDPLVAAIATDERLATFGAKRLRVVEAEGPESGHMETGDTGAEVRVAVAADGARFEQVFLDTLNGRSP